MNDRDRFAPVSLAVERPVFHLILNAGLADPLLLEILNHAIDGVFLIIITVQEIRIDHLTVSGVGFLLNVPALNDFDDIETKCLGEIIVSLVVTRDCHDRARAVSHHDVVSDKERDLLSVDRIDCANAFDLDACLILDHIDTLELALLLAFIAVSTDRIHIGDAVLVAVDQRMLRRDDHEGHAKKRIRSGRVNSEILIRTVDLEVDERTP